MEFRLNGMKHQNNAKVIKFLNLVDKTFLLSS